MTEEGWKAIVPAVTPAEHAGMARGTADRRRPPANSEGCSCPVGGGICRMR